MRSAKWRLNEPDRVIRIGNCKRSPDKLVASLQSYDGHIERFLAGTGTRFASWKVEKVAIAPKLDPAHRTRVQAHGYIPQDLADLTGDLA